MGDVNSVTQYSPWPAAVPNLQGGQDALSGYSDWFKDPYGQGYMSYLNNIMNGGQGFSGIPQNQAAYNPYLNVMGGGMADAAMNASNQMQGDLVNKGLYGDISNYNYANYLDPTAKFNQDLMQGNYSNLGALGGAFQSALNTLGSLSGGGGGMSFSFGGGGGGGGAAAGPSQIDDATMQAAIKAAANPIYDQLNRVTLPGLNSSAVSSGRYGSNAQSLAQDLANLSANRSAGEIGSKIAYDTMAKNADLRQQAMNSANQLAAAQSSAAASVYSNQQRAALDAAQQLLGYGNSLLSRQDTLAQNPYNRYVQATNQGNTGMTNAANLWGGLLPVGNQYKSDMTSQNDTNMQNFTNQYQLPLQAIQAYMSAANTGGGGTTSTSVPTYDPSAWQYLLGGLSALNGLNK